MFSEEQLEDLLEVFMERARKVNKKYLIAMGEHIRDIGQLIPSDINRLVQMQRMHENLEDIKNEIAHVAEISMEDLEKVFQAAMELDARFMADKFASVYTPSILKDEAMQRILLAQLNVTFGAMYNLSQTTVSSDAYRNLIDRGIQAVQSGVEDYNAAIRRTLAEAAEEGVQVIYRDGNTAKVQYSSGRKMRLDSAVRMNVLDGLRSLNRDVLWQIGEEYGADGIEIDAHALCAEDHLPYQGKQFSIAEFEELQRNLDRPFGKWNCKHMMYPILMGISAPAYDDSDLEEFRKNSEEKIEIDGIEHTRYEWTQVQRRLETAIRYRKDTAVAAMAAGDARLRRDMQRSINSIMEKYKKISREVKLETQWNRIRVQGFREMTRRQMAQTRE